MAEGTIGTVALPLFTRVGDDGDLIELGTLELDVSIAPETAGRLIPGRVGNTSIDVDSLSKAAAEAGGALAEATSSALPPAEIQET